MLAASTSQTGNRLAAVVAAEPRRRSSDPGALCGLAAAWQGETRLAQTALSAVDAATGREAA